MKKLFVYAAVFLVLLTGCTSTMKSEMPPVQEFGRLQAQVPVAVNDIKVIDAKTLIPRGGIGSITIQGRPGVDYNITASYRYGEKMMNTLQTKKADANGQVTWTWTVSPQTSPGTYPITISGDGKNLITTYTVTQ